MAGLHSAPLRPTDFMDFDSLLFDEERQARRAARDFVDAEVLPIIEEHAQAQRFPLHLVRMMGELGFLGRRCRSGSAAPSCRASATAC